MQDAQLVIAREYGFASWTRLKEEVLHQEQDKESTPTKDALFQILRTPDHTQADIQRVEAAETLDECLEIVVKHSLRQEQMFIGVIGWIWMVRFWNSRC